MTPTAFTAPACPGSLGGRVAGVGPPVLLLHGGPGLSDGYLDPVIAELVDGGFQVASFQQRGLRPSSTDGPFTLAQAVADVVAVLDHLAWDRAYLVGHSWGGHLAVQVAVAAPGRLLGILLVDPVGAVGDGGLEAFASALTGRLSAQSREALGALEENATGEAALATELARLRLLWPSYFADPGAAPDMPLIALSMEAGDGLWPQMVASLPTLEAALPRIRLPFGALVGSGSPMPPDAGLSTAARVPSGWGITAEGAGHFPWVERPGCVLEAVRRLVASRDVPAPD